MSESTSDWQELLEAYMAGELDEEQKELFLHGLNSSDEARAELAAVVGTDRLLKASGKPAISVADIMYAVIKDQPVSSHEESAITVPSSSPKSANLWHWPIGIAGLILLAVGFSMTRLFTGQDAPPDKTTSQADPVLVVDQDREVLADDPKPVPQTSADVQETFASAPVAKPLDRMVSQAFPLNPPETDALPDPDGDGSGEAGFVAPPQRVERADPVPAESDRFGPTPPALVAKLALRKDDPAPNDLSRLLQYAGQEHRLNSRARYLSPGALSDDPSTTPVLYFNTHHHFIFTSGQRGTLRRFILNGGMIVVSAGGGSKPAIDSARREMQHIFPELALQRLSNDHPLFHAYFDLVDPPDVEGLTLSCRTAVILLPDGIAQAWQAKEEPAMQFGINLLSYATAVRAWAKRAMHTRSYFSSGNSQGEALFVAQIEHGGEWRTRYSGLPNLLYSYNQRTEVPVKFNIKSLPLTNHEIFNHPMLYLTGHEPLQLNAREIVALRKYLENGGFLLAEACCGRMGFDRSFRRLMQQLFPRRPMTVISPDAELFSSPNRVELLGVTQSLGAKGGSMLMRPRLEGIEFGEHYGVVYSPYGIAGGWEMSQTPYADGYEDPDTIKLGQNILHYAITQ